MKDKLLGKIVKENYNNQLEKVLSKKDFSVEVKNALLSMFYKIETGFKDYKIVKRDTYDKKDYIEGLINTIEQDCDKIEFIKQDGKQQEKVSKKQKEIACEPIDIKILNSLEKINKKTITIKELNKNVTNCFSDFLNTGNDINKVEPLRDFNGFSWNIILKDIEDLDYNLIYQNMILLVGNEFLDKWTNKNDAKTDNFEMFKNILENKYGEPVRDYIITNLLKLVVWINAKKDNELKKEIENTKEDLEGAFYELENREMYLVKLSKLKKKKEREIKKIDKIMNDKKLLRQEYEKRNDALPLDKKIFSIRVLKEILLNERTKLLHEINQYNKMMKPHVFLEKKQKIEQNLKYIDIYDDIDLDQEISTGLVNLQKQVIKCMQLDIEKAQDIDTLVDLIYKYRYYNLIPANEKQSICNINKLKKDIDSLTMTLINKATDMKILIKIAEDEKINSYIMKQILISKIICLEDINIKITSEKTGIYLTIYDEETKDNKIKLENISKENIKIKFNRRIDLFI